MSKEYFYEDEDGILKDNTRSSSKGLRALATISLFFSIFVGIIILLTGFMSFKIGNGYGQITGFSAVIIAIVIVFFGYVNYVIISAVATLVENSDRSDMVDAIHELTDTIRDGNRYFYEKKRRKNVGNKATDTEMKKATDLHEEEDIDVELPEIDISDIEK